ncbi:hypothetical protein BJ508DRAFT_331507 [Ascobolus immersus RN42]|uniref:Uncharacterized protein n=1 Tax=Ascobolus immersus RN42 TaxID=1160509 RepID=A0A3N4HQA6_ASCIM|nr:hypothetical protein BJ508DRAFT_331507 [Ascobolus immersus RN42]
MENRILLQYCESQEGRPITDIGCEVRHQTERIKTAIPKIKPLFMAAGKTHRYFPGRAPLRATRPTGRRETQYKFWPERLASQAWIGYDVAGLQWKCNANPTLHNHESCFDHNGYQSIAKAYEQLEYLYALDTRWVDVQILDLHGHPILERWNPEDKTYVYFQNQGRIMIGRFWQHLKSTTEGNRPASFDAYLQGLLNGLQHPDKSDDQFQYFKACYYLARKLDEFPNGAKPWSGPFACRLEPTAHFYGCLDQSRSNLQRPKAACMEMVRKLLGVRVEDMKDYLRQRDELAVDVALARQEAISLPENFNIVLDFDGGMNEVDTEKFYTIVKEFQKEIVTWASLQ